MKLFVVATICAVALTFVSGLIFIPFLRRIKFGQPILKYVEVHAEKNGTPTMGGLFFILPCCIIFLILGGADGKLAFVSMIIGLSFMIIGFLDDFIKIKLKQNEGLKAYQKIFFQSAIAIFAGIYAYVNGIVDFFIPFSNKTCCLGVWSIPIVSFIFIAITNSVNLTDGLDGLACSVSIPYLFFIAILIILEGQVGVGGRLSMSERNNLLLLIFSLIGALLGFLIFNVNKARVFMGDTGSLSLGGFIGVVTIFSNNGFFMPIIGITFVASSISVIIQVLCFKRTGKRVFLMAPLHHHFQMKGASEAQIAYRYFCLTFILGLISLISFL